MNITTHQYPRSQRRLQAISREEEDYSDVEIMAAYARDPSLVNLPAGVDQMGMRLDEADRDVPALVPEERQGDKMGLYVALVSTCAAVDLSL